MSLKWKLILPLGIVLFFGISCMIGLISWKFASSTNQSMAQNLEESAFRQANRIQAEMESVFGGIKVLASIFNNVAGTERADRDYYNSMMRKVINESKNMFTIWAGFEPNAFDGRDAEFAGKLPMHDKTGRYLPCLINLNGKEENTVLEGYEEPGFGDYYLVPFKSGRESHTAPYHYNVDGIDHYIISLCEPIIKDGKVIGVTGADILIEPFCDALRNVKVMQTGGPLLMDHQGNIVYHRNKELWGKPFAPQVDDVVTAAIADATRDGKARLVEAPSTLALDSFTYMVAPFTLGNTGNVWIMIMTAPTAEIMAPVYSGLYMIILAGIILMAISLSLLYFSVSSIVRSLNGIIDYLDESSRHVYSAATQITDSAKQLAEGSTEQAASLEETSSALEEMASMTRQNAENTDKTKDSMVHISELFTEGSQHMTSMTASMHTISDSSEQIGHIIKTIENIAFQTNLLALNAAVEAARAGDAGKGFAVVADEVRSLALRSAQAAGDTASLIKGTMDNVKVGVNISANLEKSFSIIGESAASATRLIHEIASATNEQAQGVDQVNSAVAQIDRVMQQNAASTSESALVSEELSRQVEYLNDIVADLTGLVAGVRGGRPVTHLKPVNGAAGNRRSLPPSRQLGNSGDFF